jgi:hypothetical protein
LPRSCLPINPAQFFGKKNKIFIQTPEEAEQLAAGFILQFALTGFARQVALSF